MNDKKEAWRATKDLRHYKMRNLEQMSTKERMTVSALNEFDLVLSKYELEWYRRMEELYGDDSE